MCRLYAHCIPFHMRDLRFLVSAGDLEPILHRSQGTTICALKNVSGSLPYGISKLILHLASTALQKDCLYYFPINIVCVSPLPLFLMATLHMTTLRLFLTCEVKMASRFNSFTVASRYLQARWNPCDWPPYWVLPFLGTLTIRHKIDSFSIPW